jgi:hypothetical protein
VKYREQAYAAPDRRWYATENGFGAASWSKEAAAARVRRMQADARRIEHGAEMRSLGRDLSSDD